LNIKFWKVAVSGTIQDGIDAASAKKFPFPIVIFNFIENDWF
jgi:A/G-specific adenine glycosylase